MSGLGLIERDYRKRSNGQYYTLGNPFTLDPFKEWADKINLSGQKILEPFAGANNIIKSLQSIGLCNDFASYDIDPRDQDVILKDTLKNFPKEYKVCVTNPPWLAKNSATRRGFQYPYKYDDIYKHCIDLCLTNCDYVAALVPASFLHSQLFRDRLSTYILLHNDNIFNDTDNPVCLSLFDKENVEDTKIYYDKNKLGTLKLFEKKIPDPKTKRKIEFNHPHGTLGFVSFDNTKKSTIKFCELEKIRHYSVKASSRFITRIKCDIENISDAVDLLNMKIENFRYETKDLFLTPFKGLRRDGEYRRRMSFRLARRFINDYQEQEEG